MQLVSEKIVAKSGTMDGYLSLRNFLCIFRCVYLTAGAEKRGK